MARTGQSLAIAGTGLLAACQVTPRSEAPTSGAPSATTGPTSKPALKAVASISPPTVPPVGVSPVASPAVAAAASVAPAASAVASPSPARQVVAGGAGKPMYQMDAQHTGR